MEASDATVTLIPSSATSALKASAKALMACCEAAKPEHSGNDIFPSELDTKTMWPLDSCREGSRPGDTMML